MFFLARAAFCIGLVAFMLPTSDKTASWNGLAEHAQAVAADRLGAHCSGQPQDCVEAALATLALSKIVAAGFPATASHGSVSTLLSSDLAPVWRGRPARS